MNFRSGTIDAIATSILLTFLGFGTIGAYDASSSGVALRDALPTFALFGFVGAILAFSLSAASFIPPWMARHGKVPRQAGPCVSAVLVSLLSCVYALIWFHTYVLAGIPWFAAVSVILTAFIVLGWCIATFGLMLLVRRALPSKRLLQPSYALNLARYFALAVCGLGVASLFPATDSISPRDGSPPTLELPNIVVIVMDAVRADFVSAYGFDRPTTPCFDRVSQQGVLFADAHSTSSWTLPAVTAILSSRRAGLDVNPGVVETTLTGHTLPEVLADMGYVTLGISSNPHVYGPYGFKQKFNHFYNGRPCWETALSGTEFQTVLDRLYPSHDGKLVDRALMDITRLDRPFFIYLHLMGGHAPYRTPRGYTSLFEIPHSKREIDFPKSELEIRPEEEETLLARYASAVRYTDDQVDRLLDSIESAGLTQSTLLVLTSDHGEEFGDHEGWTHGRTLYREVVHVPLAFRWPRKIASGQSRGDIVSLLDLAPSLVGAVAPSEALIPSSWEGLDLEITGPPAIESRDRDRRLIAEVAPSLRSVITKRWKLILDESSGKRWLFDRLEDPEETTDMASHAPDVVEDLTQHLEFQVRGSGPTLNQSQDENIDPQLLKRLRSLGYIK